MVAALEKGKTQISRTCARIAGNAAVFSQRKATATGVKEMWEADLELYEITHGQRWLYPKLTIFSGLWLSAWLKLNSGLSCCCQGHIRCS